MKTSLLIIFGLTILVVVSAVKKKEGNVDKSSPKSKSPPAKKPAKKAANEDDDGISESLEDILKDDEDEVEVEIPNVEDLTTESDPIELGQQIKDLTDKKKRRALVNELKRAWNKNKGNFAGKFYQAAYASLARSKKAKQMAQAFWDRELEKVIQKAKDSSEGIVSKTKAGLGDALGNARKIAEIDPVGIALRRGESVLLSSLSNGLSTVGKVSDLAHDATRNTSKLIRAATFPIDMIPILGQIKNNVHDYIEETAERGKFLIGSAAENGSTAFTNAARNADKKADEREELLRQFSSSRRLDK